MVVGSCGCFGASVLLQIGMHEVASIPVGGFAPVLTVSEGVK
jgi:hypothetical protein